MGWRGVYVFKYRTGKKRRRRNCTMCNIIENYNENAVC